MNTKRPICAALAFSFIALASPPVANAGRGPGQQSSSGSSFSFPDPADPSQTITVTLQNGEWVSNVPGVGKVKWPDDFIYSDDPSLGIWAALQMTINDMDAMWADVENRLLQHGINAGKIADLQKEIDNLTSENAAWKRGIEQQNENQARYWENLLEAERTARESVEASLLESLAALNNGNIPTGAGITNLINDLISESLGGESLSNLLNVAITGFAGSEFVSNLVTGAVSNQLGSGAISNAISNALADYLGSSEFDDEIQSRLGDYFGSTEFKNLVKGDITDYLGSDEFDSLVAGKLDNYLDGSDFADLVGGKIDSRMDDYFESAAFRQLLSNLIDEKNALNGGLRALIEQIIQERVSVIVQEVGVGGGCACHPYDVDSDVATKEYVNGRVSELLRMINAIAGNYDNPPGGGYIYPTF